MCADVYTTRLINYKLFLDSYKLFYYIHNAGFLKNGFKKNKHNFRLTSKKIIKGYRLLRNFKIGNNAQLPAVFHFSKKKKVFLGSF